MCQWKIKRGTYVDENLQDEKFQNEDFSLFPLFFRIGKFMGFSVKLPFPSLNFVTPLHTVFTDG